VKHTILLIAGPVRAYIQAHMATTNHPPGRIHITTQFSVTRAFTSPVGPHAHFEQLVSYYFGGHARCRIGAQSVEFQTGNIGLLNAGEVHEDCISPEQRDYLMVEIKKEFFRELLRDVDLPGQDLPFFPIPRLEEDRQIKRIFEELRAESESQQLGRATFLKSLVTELAIYLLRRFVPSCASERATNSDISGLRWEVRKAVEYLQDTFTEDFDLERVSLAANLSKYHLDRVFKRATGLRPNAYVAMLRVDRAKNLLAHTSKPLADIALHLGFADQSHFSNVFKQFSGLSPRAYRRAATSICA
jgi:AraC-like DNA-binding protein